MSECVSYFVGWYILCILVKNDIQNRKVTSSKTFYRFFFFTESGKKYRSFYTISSENSDVISKAIWFNIVPSILKYMNRSRIQFNTFSQHFHPQISIYLPQSLQKKITSLILHCPHPNLNVVFVHFGGKMAAYHCC